MMSLPAGKIGGVQAAMLTPRRPGSSHIDVAALLEASDFYQEHGIEGLALLGTTGEFMHFDFEDRAKAAAMLIKRSRLPVLVNASHSTLDGTVALAQRAIDDGAYGILALPPHYFRYRQSEIKEFFWRLRERLPAARLLIYNIPFFLSEVKVETSIELLSSGAFTGIKDSSGNWDAFLQLRDLAATQPIALMVGFDGFYAKAREAGASGVVSGIAAALPDLMVALDQAVIRNDAARIQQLQTDLEEFLKHISTFPVPYGVREAARVRKLKVGDHATPLARTEAAEIAAFAEWAQPWIAERQSTWRSK
jgi:dihydrodipicolinate synthase/N-acetylneuraminate lyase